MKALHVGYNNVINVKKIVAVVSAHTLPASHLKEDARKEGLLIDASNGKKTKSLIVMESKHVIESATKRITLRDNWNKEDCPE